jgi:hypothetical protein
MQQCGCNVSSPFILNGEDQGDQLWIGSHEIHKIVGHHDNLYKATRPPPTSGQTSLPKKCNFFRNRCTSSRSERRRFRRCTLTQRGLHALIIQIGIMDVPIEKSGKGSFVFNNQVVAPTQKGTVATNDHEAIGSKSYPKYFLPRWHHPGLTHTQRRKLQRLRLREKRRI